MIELPAVVRNKALAVGAAGWLAELPAIVARLTDAWELTLGRVFPDATEALVVEVTCGDGTPAVLKLFVPRDADAADHEIAVLRATEGDGCVRLLRADEAHGAMLLERLGPSLHDLGVPYAERLEIMTTVAARVWRRPAVGLGLPTGAEKGRWLVDDMTTAWDELDRPCSERAIEHALACAERRIAAHDDERAVLVHGDVHEWNTLQTLDGAGFKLVDPDGLHAEPEYDLGVLMREDPLEISATDPHERARWLAHRTGLDATAIWEWGVVERVSTGLLATRVGLQPVGRQMLDVADRVAP